MIGIILIFLFIASYSDLKSRTIPLWIHPVLLGTRLSYFMIHPESPEWTESLLTAIFLFLLFYLFARLQMIGGGDVLIAADIGFSFGLQGMAAIIYGLLFCIPYIIYLTKSKKKSKKYPLVPFLFLGVCINIIMQLSQGQEIPWFFW